MTITKKILISAAIVAVPSILTGTTVTAWLASRGMSVPDAACCGIPAMQLPLIALCIAVRRAIARTEGPEGSYPGMTYRERRRTACKWAIAVPAAIGICAAAALLMTGAGAIAAALAGVFTMELFTASAAAALGNVDGN